MVEPVFLIYKIANLVNTKNTAITKSKAAESSAYLSTEVFNKKVTSVNYLLLKE